MSRKSSQAGFSLIESVVAIAILGLTLPLLFQSIRSAVGLMSTGERREAEWRIADDLMTEATAMLDGKEGTRQGRRDDFAWVVAWTSVDDDSDGGVDDGASRLFHVRVLVRTLNGSDDPVTLDTIRFWVAPR
jgi:prepilin-type N-terminal cleavage/methylation domain-containing protein